MHAHYASEVLENMSTDNAVDILNELSNSKVASLLLSIKANKLATFELDNSFRISTALSVDIFSNTSLA
jgi:magnesium transporter